MKAMIPHWMIGRNLTQILFLPISIKIIKSLSTPIKITKNIFKKYFLFIFYILLNILLNIT